MLQLRAPKKLMATIQTWVCVVLVVACVAFSFGPLFTLETIDNAKEIESSINEVLGDEHEVEIPEKIEISSIKLIKSISLIVDVVKVSKEIAKAENDAATSEGASETEEADVEAKIKELIELLKSEDSKNTLITAFAIANTITSVFENDSEGGKMGIGTIVTIGLVALALLYVFGFTLVFPIIFAIIALVNLIRVLSNIKEPLVSGPVASKPLSGLVVFPLVSILFQCLIPGLDFGSGTLMLLILASISTVINIVISRTRNYPNDKNVFSLIVQGGALVGAIGFIVYFFNIIKSGILDQFLHGEWSDYAAVHAIMAENKVPDLSYAYLIDGVLIFLYAVMIMSSIGYFIACIRRLTLAGFKGKYGTDARAQYIPTAIALIVGAILPFVVAGMENLYGNHIDSDPYSSLVLADSSKTVLTTAMIGLAIVLVAEIAITVCIKVFSKDLSRQAKQDILMGVVYEDAAPAKAVAAPAAVEAAPAVAATEAPVEETPAEETPAEEAPETPEAPAEE